MSRFLSRSTLIRACHNAALYCLARHAALDPAEVARAPRNIGGDPHSELARFRREAMRVRRRAIYLVVTLLDVSQSDIARALDISRVRVLQILREVEEERDDPVIDQALEELSFLGGDAG